MAKIKKQEVSSLHDFSAVTDLVAAVSITPAPTPSIDSEKEVKEKPPKVAKPDGRRGNRVINKKLGRPANDIPYVMFTSKMRHDYKQALENYTHENKRQGVTIVSVLEACLARFFDEQGIEV